jgi:hypothetical protein
MFVLAISGPYACGMWPHDRWIIFVLQNFISIKEHSGVLSKAPTQFNLHSIPVVTASLV